MYQVPEFQVKEYRVDRGGTLSLRPEMREDFWRRQSSWRSREKEALVWGTGIGTSTGSVREETKKYLQKVICILPQN